MYPELDKLMTEDEFKDMTDRIVITTEPSYLAQNTHGTANYYISEKIHERCEW